MTCSFNFIFSCLVIIWQLSAYFVARWPRKPLSQKIDVKDFIEKSTVKGYARHTILCEEIRLWTQFAERYSPYSETYSVWTAPKGQFATFVTAKRMRKKVICSRCVWNGWIRATTSGGKIKWRYFCAEKVYWSESLDHLKEKENIRSIKFGRDRWSICGEELSRPCLCTFVNLCVVQVLRYETPWYGSGIRKAKVVVTSDLWSIY